MTVAQSGARKSGLTLAVIGSGAREAAIAWKLRQSSRVKRVFVLPGNDGTIDSRPVDPADIDRLAVFCREEHVDLVIVGPEKPLIEGIVETLNARGIRTVGPDAQAARLEGSKCFAKRFMQTHGVATSRWAECGDLTEARRRVTEFSNGVVLKYDGLAAGKGVFVCADQEAFERACAEFSAAFGAAAPLVLEERLDGREVSIIGFTNGDDLVLLPPAQDHKQLLDGDRGPNTGGMGAFCPVPWVDAALLARIDETIVAPTLRGIRREGFRYRGPLYFGIMVAADGPRLLEYNVRLGDPETQVLLPALAGDLLEWFEACLHDGPLQISPRFHPGYQVGVVLAGEGYPARSSHGTPIAGFPCEQAEPTDPGPNPTVTVDPGPNSIPTAASNPGPDPVAASNPAPGAARVFAAGVKRDVSGALVTGGGRILTVVGHGPTLPAARVRAYAEADRISFPGKQCRRDIGIRPGTWQPTRLAIGISGRGTNMTALLDDLQAPDTTGGSADRLAGIAEAAVIFSDNPTAPGIKVAQERGCATLVLPPAGESREDYDRRLVESLAPYHPDFIILAGYRRIVSPFFVERFRGRIINIHPADSRKYQGLHGYRWAFENRLPRTTITIHFVDEGVDTGDIIAQRTVDLTGVTSLEDVENRGLAVEHCFFPEVLASFFRKGGYESCVE